MTADDTDGGVGTDIFAFNAVTGKKTLLTASIEGGTEGESYRADWSPNGSKLIVYSGSTLTSGDTNDSGGDLYAVNPVSGAKTLLTGSVEGGYQGDSNLLGWGPNGATAIVASSSSLTADDTDGGNSDLFAVNINNGAKTLLTGVVDGGLEGRLSWVWEAGTVVPHFSADGRSMMVITELDLTNGDLDGGGVDLYWINLKTGEKSLVDLGLGSFQDFWAEGRRRWGRDRGGSLGRAQRHLPGKLVRLDIELGLQ